MSYYITAENIGSDATYEDAQNVAEFLTEAGYEAEAFDTCGVTPAGYQDANDIPDDVWSHAMEYAAELGGW